MEATAGGTAEFKIASIDKKAEAAKLGYQKGDEIVAIAGEPPGENALVEYLRLADNGGAFRIRRKKAELELPSLFQSALILESRSPKPSLGKRAPALKVDLPEGVRDYLERVEGNVILLNFLATWCKPCMEEMPILVRLHRQYQPRGFLVIGINLDEDVGAAKSYIKEQALPFVSIHTGGFDHSIPLDYGVKSIPSNFFIDRDRYVVQVFTGFSAEASEEELSHAIDVLLDKREPVIVVCRE